MVLVEVYVIIDDLAVQTILNKCHIQGIICVLIIEVSPAYPKGTPDTSGSPESTHRKKVTLATQD